MEGSFRTIPLPFMWISVFAVPRSIARSAEKKEKKLMRFRPVVGECSLVSEVPDAGEEHGDVVLVCRLDDFLVAHRAARLDHRGGAGFHRFKQPVGERKKRIGGN